MIAITMDLEMARNFPHWEDTHWDYEKGNLDEAAYTAMNLLPDIGQVSSGRVSLHLAQLRSSLGQPQRSTAATRKFVEAYDQAVHA